MRSPYSKREKIDNGKSKKIKQSCLIHPCFSSELIYNCFMLLEKVCFVIDYPIFNEQVLNTYLD